jgi:hypothetical protein
MRLPGLWRLRCILTLGLAVHWFFEANARLPEYLSYAELWKDTPNVIMMVGMYSRFRFVVPVYVGVAYSVGAFLSLHLSTSHPSSETKDAIG